MSKEGQGKNGAALAQKAPLSPLAQWKSNLLHEHTLSNLAKVLSGTGIHPERFAMAAFLAMQRTPKLFEAKPIQLWTGVYAAAECGLSMQAHMQQYHLVPFGGEVTPIIGYQGLTFLAEKASGGLIEPPQLIYQRDVEEKRFRWKEGTKRYVDFDPVVRDPTRPKGQLLYVVTTYVNARGTRTFQVLDRETLLEAREKSAGWKAFSSGKRKSSPWAIEHTKDGSEGGHWPAMCAKTGIRRIGKIIPKSADHWGERAAKAEAVDAALDNGEDTAGDLGGVLDTTVSAGLDMTGTEKLKEELGLRPEDAQFTEWKPPEPPPEIILPGQRITKEDK
jgi:recombinational DNA repair protein RecT